MRGQATLMASARTQGGRDGGSTDVWSTPQKFFELLNGEFNFTLDPCADADNAKCTYFDEAADGLAQDWGDNVCFVNFPYSQAKAWARKCVDSAAAGALVVVLCAARTDTGWFQYLASYATVVRFIKGRLAFVGPNGAGQSATFPSCVIVLRPGLSGQLVHNGLEQARMSLWDVPADVRR